MAILLTMREKFTRLSSRKAKVQMKLQPAGPTKTAKYSTSKLEARPKENIVNGEGKLIKTMCRRLSYFIFLLHLSQL